MKLLFAFALLIAGAAAGIAVNRPLLKLMPMLELEGRITNGEVAGRTQFPYQAGLQLAIGSSGAWCGGTLISRRFVLTAAHCTADADSVVVYLGAWNIKDEKEVGQQRIKVEKAGIYTHKDYDASTITNDIALIKLPAEIAFNEYIQKADLPDKEDVYDTYVGKTVVASGWGKDSDSATAVSDKLNYIDSTVISKLSCNVRFFGMVTDNMLCISGKDGRSTCNGDSGGPLVYKQDDKNIVIGATSFGIALGCEIGWPGVFTRVTSYLDWISDITKA